MTSERQSLIIGITISIMLSVICHQGSAIARGGGAGFGRGNFGRGGFDRGDFDRGFDRYGSDLGDMHGYARPDSLEHVPAAAENRTYNWGDHGLSTDNGLNRAASAMTPGEAGRRYTPAQLAEDGNMVRGAYGYPGVFDSGWYGAHPNAWRYAGWGNYGAWGATDWPVMAGWWGMPVDTAPVPYDYGNNITYQNDTVYYGSQPMESSVAYYQQAQTLAQSVPISAEPKSKSSAKDWKPLGVYSLVQGGQSNTNMMFQLAVNKKGAIKGNYYNTLTDETKPVSGAVDKKNMRAAWIVGNNKNVVYDSGLSNLLKEQSPVLVHLSKEKTQQWNLVRLQQPKKEA
jgi:hypothetical protein